MTTNLQMLCNTRLVSILWPNNKAGLTTRANKWREHDVKYNFRATALLLQCLRASSWHLPLAMRTLGIPFYWECFSIGILSAVCVQLNASVSNRFTLTLLKRVAWIFLDIRWVFFFSVKVGQCPRGPVISSQTQDSTQECAWVTGPLYLICWVRLVGEGCSGSGLETIGLKGHWLVTVFGVIWYFILMDLAAVIQGRESLKTVCRSSVRGDCIWSAVCRKQQATNVKNVPPPERRCLLWRQCEVYFQEPAAWV